MRKFLIYAAVAGATAIGGVGGAFATSAGTAVSPQHQAISKLQMAERAAMNMRAGVQRQQLMSAIHRAEVSVRTSSARNVRASKGNACPPQSQGGRQGITVPPCGIDHNGILPVCPPKSKNGGNAPPCGHPSSPPPAAPCGPQDQGGSAATGPLTGPIYGIGVQISDGGGAPIGDLVQSVACAVFNLTGGNL